MSFAGAHPLGATLNVQVIPGAKQARVREIRGDVLVIAINAVPEKGRANEAVRAFLAECLGIRRSEVELLRGDTSRRKQWLIRDCPPEELELRVKGLLKMGD